MDFIQARLEDTINRKYILKQRKLNSAVNFMKEYYCQDGNLDSLELKRNANEYFLASNGITSYDEPDLENFSKTRVENIYREICKQSNETFIKFYNSYKRKIDKGYNKEFIDSAFQDLIKAYKLYSIANNLGIQEEPNLQQLELLNTQILKSIDIDKIENIK